MPLGSNRRYALSLLALLFSPALLSGCGNDDAPTPKPASPTTGPTAYPTVEPTPAIEPATGILLRMNYAEIRMPEGWTRKNNFGVPFLRQGASGTGQFGTLTWTELNMNGIGENEPTSLDAIAKRHLRVSGNKDLQRVEDAIIGGDTMAYRMVDTSSKNDYEENYGVLMGNIEYSMQFTFSIRDDPRGGTRDEAIATIESMLATWDFNPA